MNIFKFWVKTALVLASALGVISIISVIVFQVLYGWHTDILSPIEHLVKVLLLGGFKIAWVCVGLAIAKLLMLVYTGEVLTKEPPKPVEEAPLPKAPVTYWPLVQRIRNYLTSRGYHLLNTEYANIAMFALSMLDAKNIPIPEKDEDLWKLIEPKVKQYTKPTTSEESFDPICVGNPVKVVEQYFSDDLGKEPWIGGVETPAYKSVKDRLTEVAQTPIQDADAAKPNTDCPNRHPKFSVRHRLGSILKNHGFMGDYDLGALYDYLLLRINAPSLDRSSNAEIWDAIQSAVIAGDFKLKNS